MIGLMRRMRLVGWLRVHSKRDMVIGWKVVFSGQCTLCVKYGLGFSYGSSYYQSDSVDIL